jgi:hypothetical protein
MRTSEAEDPPDLHERRKKWLEDVKRAVPSCFTDDIL